MEFVITQGQVQLAPIPPADPSAPEGARAGYLLNITDAATGIIVRVSMGHDHAARLGQVMVDDTQEHPAWAPATVETFGVIPGGLTPPGENGG